MCLILKTNRIQRLFYKLLVIPKIAKEDIVVYKIYHIYKPDSRIDEFKFRSAYSGTEHSIGTQPEVKFGIKEKSSIIFKNEIVIEEGYHSYIDIPINEDLYYHYSIVKCIIPKGAKYFTGGINNTYSTDGYVSNSLVIVGKL